MSSQKGPGVRFCGKVKIAEIGGTCIVSSQKGPRVRSCEKVRVEKKGGGKARDGPGEDLVEWEGNGICSRSRSLVIVPLPFFARSFPVPRN